MDPSMQKPVGLSSLGPDLLVISFESTAQAWPGLANGPKSVARSRIFGPGQDFWVRPTGPGCSCLGIIPAGLLLSS
jgi:hypothetical protein